MAFLKLDGLTIPIDTASPSLSYSDVGGFARAANGGGILSLQTQKRIWECSTIPLSESAASAWEAILAARGLLHQWRAAANASNGRIPVTSGDLSYQIGRSTLTGARYPINDVPFGFLDGEYSLAAHAARTNVLTAKQSTLSSDPATWSAAGEVVTYATGGGTLARSTAISFDGAGAWQVVSPIGGEGVRWERTITAATALSASAYVFVPVTSATTTMQIQLFSGSSTGALTTRTITPGRWTRIFSPPLTTASSTSAILEVTAPNGIDTEFYIDRVQIERVAPHHAWVPGGTTGAAATMDIASGGLPGWEGGYTFATWLRADPAASGSTQAVWAPTGSMGSIELGMGADTFTLRARAGASPAASQLSVAKSVGAWHHVAMSCYPAPNGSAILSLWVDGALAGTTASQDPALYGFSAPSLWATGLLGSGGGLDPFNGLFSNTLLLPGVIDATMAAALYASTDPYGSWPQHRITGDIAGSERAIYAYAQLTGAEPVDFIDSVGAVQRGRRLKFRLVEI